MTFLEYFCRQLILRSCKSKCLKLLCQRKPGLNRRYLWRELKRYIHRQGSDDLPTWTRAELLLTDNRTHVTLSMQEGLKIEFSSYLYQVPVIPRVSLVRLEGSEGANCRYYSGSLYLKCAVNPAALCDECPHFEPKTDE